MPVIAPPLADIMPGLPPGPIPFGRKAWDNPVRFRLNRPYGDEFEHQDFRSLSRRWELRNAVAADFSFPGGSTIEWIPSGAGSALLMPAPPGDFEIVLEFSGAHALTNNSFVGPCIVDASGAGEQTAGFGSLYTFLLTGYAYGNAQQLVAIGSDTAAPHCWITLKKSGTDYSCRGSITGTSWTAFNTPTSNAMVPAKIGILRGYVGGETSWLHLHRFNVYPGPTFFPG